MKKLLLLLIVPLVIMMMACTCSKSGHKPVKCPGCPYEQKNDTVLSFAEAHVRFSGNFRLLNDTIAQRLMGRAIFIKRLNKDGQYRYYLAR